MKTTRVRMAVWTAVFVPLTGCSDFIAPAETDPNAVPDATVNQLFVAHQALQYIWHGGTNSRFTSVWMQQMGGTARQHANIELYDVGESDFDDMWDTAYQGGGLIDLEKAIAKAEEAGQRVYAGIIKLHEAYLMGMMASIFGDIPLSQAVNPIEFPEPVLDEQLSVYSAMQTLLDAAIADLGSGQGGGPGPNDFNFGGDASRWITVAHSLKARFHLHLVEVEGSGRYQQALAEAQQGISDISGNWHEVHTTSTTESNNWFNWEVRRAGDIRAGAFLMNFMNGGTPADFTDDDPRTSIYWSTGSGDFVGQYIGHQVAAGPPDPGPNASFINVPAQAAYGQPILTCSETQFIIAEASFGLGDEAGARAAAKAAIGCQEAFWSVDLSALEAGFDALSGQALLEKIMEQKFVANFLEIDIWNDYKRTCLPARTPAPGFASIIGRMLYSTLERQTNSNVPPPEDQPLRNDNDPNPC